MKKTILLFTSATVLLLGSCKKEEVDTKPKDFEELKTRVIFNFAEDVAMRTYGDVNNAALKFATSVENFQISNNQGDFDKVKANWRNLLNLWKQTESFHFGPVAKGNYRAKIDTWPTYISDLEAIMASGNQLNVADVEKLPDNLRGLHAIEYLIFGVDGLKKASNCSDREKKYMVSLSRDISNNCLAVFNEWTGGSASYGSSIIYAGNNSSVFKTKKELFATMVGGMKDLCKRLVVDNLGKPYDAIDSTVVESPYSNLSLSNIALNITSLKSIYTGRYNDTSNYGLRDIVKDKNSALDGKIGTRMAAIDSALSAIKMPLDSAIIFKRAETKTAIDAVDSLRSTIELELMPFIEQNISN